MHTTYRQISSVLEAPLIFSPVVNTSTPSAARSASAATGGTTAAGLTTVPFTNSDTIYAHASGAEDNALISLDLNHRLWAHLSARHNTAATSTYAGITSAATGATTQYTSLQQAASKTYDALEQPWQVAAQPEIMVHMVSVLVVFYFAEN